MSEHNAVGGAPGGREVLVTGCSSGIGRHVVNGLKDRGYRVFATARKPEDVSALAAAGHEALQLDLADSNSIQAAVEGVRARTGGRLYATWGGTPCAGSSRPMFSVPMS